jgi:H+-translocating NAD(P) transhydrogenase subunit alpha
MILGVAKENIAGEKRVAQTPETVTALSALGFEVWVEKGAGLMRAIPTGSTKPPGAKLQNR